MINNTINTDKLAHLFKNNIAKQIKIDKLNKNNIPNKQTIPNHKLFNVNFKGLNLLIKNWTEFNLKTQTKKFIINSKNNTLSTPTIESTFEENKIEIVNKNENLKQETIPMNILSENKKNTNNNNNIKNINNNKNNKNNTQTISEYLKSITIYNSIPIGKMFTFSQQQIYNFNTVNNKLIKKLYTFLFYSFFSMDSLISKPIFNITNDQIVIHLFYFNFDFIKNKKNTSFKNISYNEVQNGTLNSEIEKLNNKTFIRKNTYKLDLLCKLLSKFFNKPVELHLIKLNYPYLDSNIFVNLLALMINKKNIRFIMKKFFKFVIIKNIANKNKTFNINKIPSFLSGIKIKIAGRLLTQRVIPRKTVKVMSRGAYSRSKVNFLDIARYTGKNKRGAFSITVTTGQNLMV